MFIELIPQSQGGQYLKCAGLYKNCLTPVCRFLASVNQVKRNSAACQFDRDHQARGSGANDQNRPASVIDHGPPPILRDEASCLARSVNLLSLGIATDGREGLPIPPEGSIAWPPKDNDWLRVYRDRLFASRL